ncbi:LacI family DNA-binding transcriptional regulator [Litchfieldia salsa]|uniref:Transcriptional regulator, LacI family n=1 Tax=Litchfieldia salsa TaxID=930152 RepID=A0A1H0RML4_9BACI|nr:LacI family DNA-binding transcriptional regulator [Litchfieldia salsa]SDP30599.1 transcriptional regulator, LacI family [Litchfieldia salsa]
MGVTIKDIAKLANVSHTTVSRALNNSPLIKPDTKNKIMEIATMLNYTPDFNAKSLVMQKSYTIGLFFSYISDGTSASFLADTIKGVNRVIDENYNLYIRAVSDIKDFSIVNSKRFDGIILMSQSNIDNPFIYDVIQKEIPLIVLNREIEDPSILNILSNDKEGVYEAISTLIKYGHRQIGLIEGVEGFKSSQERRDGYLKALIENNISINDQLIVKGNYDMESGYNAMKELLNKPVKPTAVFCSNDEMAIGGLNAALELGYQVPEDLSIIGFDDIGFAKYTTPSLTTIKRPIEEISIMGLQKLFSLINGEAPTQNRFFLNTELVIRNSVNRTKYES